VGVGVFSNFAQHLEYPSDWQGRERGTFFDLTTTTINPSIALRPIPQLAIGFGLAIVPSSMGLRQGVTDGLAHSATTAVGFGGNVGVLVYLVPRYLHFGASYRSSMDLDFAGTGRIDQTGMALQQQNAAVAVALPHNFSFGLSSKPIPALTLAADAHLTLWRDLASFTTELKPPGAAMGDLPTKVVLDLSLRDAVGVRVGAEYRLLADRVRVRLGGGFDTTPVRAAFMGPLIPDSYRVTIGAGLGYRHGALGVEAAYSAGILLDRTATTRDLPATYGSVAHLVALAVTVRMEELGTRVNVPEYKH
jgi:long-subunit fatty acid transport protein